MNRRSLLLASVVAFGVAVPSPAHAAHHLWRLQQLFSNASGTVQFVELETTTAGRTGETNVSGFTITSGGNTFQFSGNLAASATTQWLLLATSNEASTAGGVTPDFIIPANFFSTGGGTISYASGVDTWTYGTVPTDGVNALSRDPNTQAVTVATNAPVNFANVAGQISLAPVAPALPAWGVVAAIGALLLAGSGLLRRGKAEAV
jgi:serralysin